MIKIKETTQLPEWFNLEKYSKANDLDAAGWFIQLSHRKEFYDLYAMMEREGKDESSFFIGDPIFHRMVRKSLEHLRSQPIKTFPVQTASYETLYTECRALDYRKDLSIKPVRGLSLQDLTAQRLTDQWEVSEGIGNICQASRWKILAASELGECPTEPVLVGSLGQNGFAIFVDLNATDTVLKKAFALWLKEARKNSSGIPHKQSKFYDRWARSGLLPYLDLRIWAMEKKYHIPGHVMSKAINRNDTGEENLRKTLVPIAISLMDDLSELQALAAIESATLAPDVSENSDG